MSISCNLQIMCDNEDSTVQEIEQHMAPKEPIVCLQKVEEIYPTLWDNQVSVACIN